MLLLLLLTLDAVDVGVVCVLCEPFATGAVTSLEQNNCQDTISDRLLLKVKCK